MGGRRSKVEMPCIRRLRTKLAGFVAVPVSSRNAMTVTRRCREGLSVRPEVLPGRGRARRGMEPGFLTTNHANYANGEGIPAGNRMFEADKGLRDNDDIG